MSSGEHSWQKGVGRFVSGAVASCVAEVRSPINSVSTAMACISCTILILISDCNTSYGHAEGSHASTRAEGDGRPTSVLGKHQCHYNYRATRRRAIVVERAFSSSVATRILHIAVHAHL